MANNTTTKKSTTAKSTSKTTTAKKKTTTKSTSKKTSTPKTTTTTKITRNKKAPVTPQQERESNVILTVLGILALVIVAIVIFRLTYAFFTAQIEDNNPGMTDVQVATADLEVEYGDGKAYINSEEIINPNDENTIVGIFPGDIITKDFSVINKGNDTGYYAIVLENLINTFDVQCKSEEDDTKGEIAYTLYKTDSEYSDDSLSTIGTGAITLPCTTENNPQTVSLIKETSVEKDATNYYRLKIEYKNLSIDQSENMDTGKLVAKVNIVESETEQRTQQSNYN